MDEVPWNQNVEGVEAGVDQEGEDRQLRPLRLLRIHGRDPFTMRHRKQVEHAAQLGHCSAFNRGLLQFSSSRKVRGPNKPEIPDGADQRIGCLARNPRHQSPSAATGS